MSRDPAELNRAVYERAAIVGHYRARGDLLPGEAAVLRAMAGSRPLEDTALLDIGCGAGRTAEHLLPRVGGYVGLDYAGAMVASCRERFAERFPEACFLQADARDLSAFADAAFDAALFSFNGLDTLDHDGRTLALREIRRVLKPGGAFVYSTHLLPNVEPRFSGHDRSWHASSGHGR